MKSAAEYHLGLLWKLRRIAAGLRQQDIASAAGMSTTRYSAIERGEQQPTDLDRNLIECKLPPLPSAVSVPHARKEDAVA